MRGANFLIDSTPSIDSPPEAVMPVVSAETPEVTTYSTALRLYESLPENLKLLTPFAASPLEVM